GLVVVLIPGVGHEVNGAQRWISLGVMNIQVSEFAKVGTTLYVASYLMRHGQRLQSSFDAFLKPLVLLSLAGVLCLLEPDYGATVVLMTIAVGMIFLGGARVGQFVLCVVLLIGIGGFFIYISDYRMNRVVSFFDPWADPFGGAFQLVQSLIAVGSGAITGVGFGGSVQKLLYLPEAHTDFVFAVYAEELGLIGVCVLVGLYCALITMMVRVAQRAERSKRAFGAFVVYGVVIWVACQTFISMSVNMGLLPTKGLTLPFLSYGGSSALALFIAFGLIIRIGLEARLAESQGGKA
ncbi:MAG: putative peptidoglycan glycosyltransferase FtsW, partial [Pseudomonadota bacterium]